MQLSLGLIGLIPLVAGLVMVSGPVNPRRPQLFAARHGLVLTPDNQPHVVAYLAHTRRWRTAGVACAYVLTLAATLPHQRIGVEAVPLLAGWLVGAAVAEMGYRGPARDRSPGIALSPAGLVVPGWLTRVPLVLASFIVVTTGLIVARGPDGLASSDVADWGFRALAAVGVVAVINWHLRRRPELHTDSATNRALRLHSIGAITAAGTTLALFCLLRELDAIKPYTDGPATVAIGGITVMWAIGAVVFGVIIAVAASSVGDPPTDPISLVGRPTGHLTVVAVVLVIASSSWAGYAWWQMRPPYSPADIHAVATIRFTDNDHFDQDALALGVEGFNRLLGSPGDQVFLGRVDLVVPAKPHAGAYHIVVIDKRTNDVALFLANKNGGGGAGGFFGKAAKRYPWLSAMAPVQVGSGWMDPGMALEVAANTTSPITFFGMFAHAAGSDPSDLLVALIFEGPQGQLYWATRLLG